MFTACVKCLSLTKGSTQVSWYTDILHWYALSSSRSPPLAYTMMIRHWAPTIRDGYAYHGRPQKPGRLILAHHLGSHL